MSTQGQSHMQQQNLKTIGTLIRELGDDLKNFAETRVQIFTQEMNQKINAIKAAIPLFVVALLFAFIALLGLTAALVYVIGLAVGMGWAMLIVGCLYLLIAGAAAMSGYSKIKQGIAPKRTLEILKQDQVWLRQEARSA